MSDNNQVSIFELAKQSIDQSIVDKIKTDIEIFNSANTETKNAMFKIASQKSRIIENYGAILYETANDLGNELEAVENKLSLALNSGELSTESIERMNSSISIASSSKSSKLKDALNNKLKAKGKALLGPNDRLFIQRN